MIRTNTPVKQVPSERVVKKVNRVFHDPFSKHATECMYEVGQAHRDCMCSCGVALRDRVYSRSQCVVVAAERYCAPTDANSS